MKYIEMQFIWLSEQRIARTTAREADAKRAEWTERRDKAIAVARSEGATLREIARATGLTHVGVKKIHDGRAATG